jgi:Family of unknown function (DUF5996)
MNLDPDGPAWPDLSALDLRSTTDTLHLWSQVAGKVRLMIMLWLNHSWHATFYLSGRGFTTGLVHVGPLQAFSMEKPRPTSCPAIRKVELS